MNLSIRRIWATGSCAALCVMVGAAWAQSPTSLASMRPEPMQQQQAPQTDQTQAQQAPQQTPTRKLEMVEVKATLDKTLDAKKAKQGDPVMAKLQQDVQIPNAQALPRNTVLEGHVDQVQASEHKSDSVIVVTFDKAKLKDGQELPIKATVIALSQPPSMQQSGAGAPGQPMSSGMPMSSAPSGGGAPGGGSMGGTSGGTPSQPMSMPQASAGGGQPQGQTAVPDVTLKSSIHDHSSATLTAKGHNVHVPDGTQMQVALTIVPAGVTLQ